MLTSKPTQHAIACESFLQSLASIHRDPTQSMSRSRRHSLSERDGKLLARSLSSGSSPQVNHGDSEGPRTSPQGHLNDVHGILKTHDDNDAPVTPSHHRVSFARHLDGTINQRMSNSPRDVGASGSPFASPQVTSSRPSLEMMLSPPPLPSSKKSSLSEIHPKTSKMQLPFLTPLESNNKSNNVRRHSKFEMEHSVAASKSSHQHKKQRMSCCSRKDYILGQALRTPKHMIIENCPQAATEKVSQLKKYDFAFIKRSDGSWTYAILAYRSEEDECMMFVMDERGSTKVFTKKQWAKWVCCVAADEKPPQREVVPRSVSVFGHGEDCSMLTYLS